MSEPAPTRMSYAEYLEADAASETKLEYVDGHAVAMTGGSIRHAAVIGNLLGPPRHPRRRPPRPVLHRGESPRRRAVEGCAGCASPTACHGSPWRHVGWDGTDAWRTDAPR